MQNFSFISLFGKKLDGVGKFTYPPRNGVSPDPPPGIGLTKYPVFMFSCEL